mgnify:FL=1
MSLDQRDDMTRYLSKTMYKKKRENKVVYHSE